MSTNYLEAYHPDLILKDPAFKVYSESTVPYNKNQNLSIAYNAHKEIHLVQRPRPVPRGGEVIVHIRATYVDSFPLNSASMRFYARFDRELTLGFA